ncbi:MAG: Crp/Fnr family transcriptional regulator [Hormoscilla sp. GUM202]|nr:Crp/Fnr family transcriptional regulator [Hormoscilla sp. GUM202]
MVYSLASEAVDERDLRQLLEEIYQERNLSFFCSGQNIPMGDRDIWVVYRGVVQLNILYPSGEEGLLGLAADYMPFGLPLTAIDAYYATALSDVDLMRLTVSEVDQSPTLAQSIWRQLNRRLRQTEAMLALVGHRRVKDRLVHLLLLLKEEIGQPVSEGTRLNVKLTHQHLANAIGTTRVTVTRILGELRQEGWLNIDWQRHIIIRPSMRG